MSDNAFHEKAGRSQEGGACLAFLLEIARGQQITTNHDDSCVYCFLWLGVATCFGDSWLLVRLVFLDARIPGPA